MSSLVETPVSSDYGYLNGKSLLTSFIGENRSQMVDLSSRTSLINRKRDFLDFDAIEFRKAILNFDDLKSYLLASPRKVKVATSMKCLEIPIPTDNRPSFELDLSFIIGKEHTDIWKMLVFERELGKGISGTVNKCSDLRSGISYACKSVRKSGLTVLDVQNLQSEVQSLRSLQQHPSVVKFQGVYEHFEQVHLVMEFCPGGDLFDRIKERKFFAEQQAATICQKIASVIQFAHCNGIVHRDLKPENILLASTVDDTDIRVADFGSAAFFMPGEQLTHLVGSPYYVAPEVIRKRYGPEVDLWSLGVVLYILLCGKPPFTGSNTADILWNVQFGELDLVSERWAFVSHGAKKLVSRLLTKKREKRILARQVLKHPWIVHHCGNGCMMPMNPVTGSSEAITQPISIKSVELCTVSSTSKQGLLDSTMTTFSNLFGKRRTHSDSTVRKQMSTTQ